MNTKPQAPGQWAQQQKIAEKKQAKKHADRQPQMEQTSGEDAQPMAEPRKSHGDKIKARPGEGGKPETPEGQGGIGGP
jgi:hypothetical protein